VSSLFHRFPSFFSSPIYKSGCEVAQAVWLSISILRCFLPKGDSLRSSSTAISVQQHSSERDVLEETLPARPQLSKPQGSPPGR